jgi:hypothetical protein
MHEVFQPPSEIPAPRLVELDGTAAVEEIVAAAIDALVAQAEDAAGAGRGRREAPPS